MSQSQQPPAGGSVPRRVGFHSRLQRELEREGTGSEGSGPPPRSLLNASRTAEATAAARRAAAMQSEGDHDADLLNGQDPLAATPSRRPSSVTAATSTTATTASLPRTRQHASSSQPPPPLPHPALRQIPPPRDLLRLQEQEREQQDTTLFSSPPPAMSTLPIYRTPRADQQATVTLTSRAMGFDSPAMFASSASPSWSSVDHHGPLTTTPEVYRPTLLRSLLEISEDQAVNSIDGSDLEQEVETVGDEEDEGLYAGNLSFGEDPRELSFRMSRGVQASWLSPTPAASVSPTPVSLSPSPTQVASSLASTPIASSAGTSLRGRRSQSPSRPYGEWRQHARRLELQYASRYGSPRRERGEPQGRLEFGHQQDEVISRRRHAALQPYNARFLQGDEDGTISPPRRLDLAAMTLSPSTPAAATIVAGRVNTSSSALMAATSAPTAPAARATITAATEAVAASSTTAAVQERTGTTAASLRTRLADDPDEFWSSSSSGQRSTRLLPNIPSSRPGLVPRFYRRGHGTSSSSSLSLPQPPSRNSDTGNRSAVLPRTSRSAQEDDTWQDVNDRRRPLERERQPAQTQQQQQHQHQQQRQQDQDPRRQDREREPEEQYVHEIYEDPESDEAADGEEYDQNEPSGQNKELAEQDKAEAQEEDEDEEEEEEEDGGVARVDPSVDLLLDASRAYRARHLSNAGRRLSHEDAEDPFQSSGMRHKRARFNESLESLEGEVSITGGESFGGNVLAEMGVAGGSLDNQSADMVYRERDLTAEDVDEADNTALLYDDLDEQGRAQQQQQLPDGHPPSSLYNVDVDTSLQVGLADSDAEADMATVDEADLYGLFESPPPELESVYRRSVDAYEEQDHYGQQPSHLHDHDEGESFPEHAMMVPPPSVQQQGSDQQDQPYMNGGLSSDSEPEEATVSSDDDTDEDEEDDEEEAERLQQLIEATVNQGPEAVAVLSGFRAPGSAFQGKRLLQISFFFFFYTTWSS